MLDRLRSVLPLVACALLAGCTANTSENDPTVEADEPAGTNEPAPSEKTTASARLGGVDLAAPRLPEATVATPSHFDLSLDGVTCSVQDTSLQQMRTAWTLTAQANCGYMVTLKISGRTDVRYPQTALNPFGNVQAATLVIENIDKHQLDTFTTWQEGSEVILVNGPTADTRAPVEGMALVGEGSVDHYLRFKLHY